MNLVKMFDVTKSTDMSLFTNKKKNKGVNNNYNCKLQMFLQFY